jgi:hypothetical protein
MAAGFASSFALLEAAKYFKIATLGAFALSGLLSASTQMASARYWRLRLISLGGAISLLSLAFMAQGRHRSVKVLPKYVKRTTDQVASGAEKRRASRTKTDHSSK